MSQLTKEQPDLYYSVQFVYPADEAAARQKQAEKLSIVGRLRGGCGVSTEGSAFIGSAGRNRRFRSNNFHYIAQGDRSLTPLEVFDNGVSTVFRFPGNVRIPSIYVINPDGKEATANYSVKGDYVEVPAVAREWRLRDGHTVLGIWNSAYDPIGRSRAPAQ